VDGFVLFTLKAVVFPLPSVQSFAIIYTEY
jgi:hypothetical protein